MNKLQKALRLNALFSGVSGIVLLIFHSIIANQFEVEQSTVFWIVGIGLIVFSSTIFWEIKKQRRIAVVWIIIQDLAWVIGSSVLLVFQPFVISNMGNMTIAGVALVVLLMALNQWNAWNKIGVN